MPTRLLSAHKAPVRAMALLGAGLLSACATPRLPYDEADSRAAQVFVPGARSFADTPDPAFAAGARAALASRSRETSYLALSGGGGDGAFGAGILAGWTESGTRPDFTIVSGVSTGALIAPFAFLGPRYDATLAELYTSGLAETLLSSPDPFRALLGSSVFSDDRLRALVARYVTPDLVAEVAAEHRRGRQLFVVTTNLDAQRPVVWDLGTIAAEGSPRAIDLFRDALVASASIPAVFPPVLVDATTPEGRPVREMHVDGTITTSVFTLPRQILWSGGAGRRLAGRLFVLMNAKLDTDFALVPNTTGGIGARSVATLIKGGARSDIVDTWQAARRLGLGFHVASIGREMPVGDGAGFDTASMRRLYAYGLERGRTGRFWDTRPPALAPDGRAAPSR